MALIKSYKTLSFEISNSEIKGSLLGIKGDSKSRGFYVDILQDGLTYPITDENILFFAEKPDKTKIFIDGILDDGKFRVDLPDQMFAVSGRVHCQLVLRDVDNGQLSSGTFEAFIDKGIIEDSLVSKDERNIIDKIFDISENLIPNIIEIEETIRTDESVRKSSEIDRENAELSRKESFIGYENRVESVETSVADLNVDYNSIKPELIQAKNNANASALNADTKANLANEKAILADNSSTNANNKMVALEESYVDLDEQHNTVIGGFSLLPSKTNQTENISALQKISDNLKIPVGGISSVLKIANQTIDELVLLQTKLEQDLDVNDSLVSNLELMIGELNELKTRITTISEASVGNETDRITKESSRVTSENERIVAEGLRVFEEGVRATAEISRQLAEQNRVDSFNSYDTRVTSVESGFIEHKKDYTAYKPELVDAKNYADHSAVNANNKAILAEEKANLASNKILSLESAYVDLDSQHSTIIGGFTLLPSKTNQIENISALQKISRNLKVPVGSISTVLRIANKTIDEMVALKEELESEIAIKDAKILALELDVAKILSHLNI